MKKRSRRPIMHRHVFGAMTGVGVLTTLLILAEDIAGFGTHTMAHTLTVGYLIALALWVWSLHFCIVCGLPLVRGAQDPCRDPAHYGLHLPWSEIHVDCCFKLSRPPPTTSRSVPQLLQQQLRHTTANTAPRDHAKRSD